MLNDHILVTCTSATTNYMHSTCMRTNNRKDPQARLAITVRFYRIKTVLPVQCDYAKLGNVHAQYTNGSCSELSALQHFWHNIKPCKLLVLMRNKLVFESKITAKGTNPVHPKRKHPIFMRYWTIEAMQHHACTQWTLKLKQSILPRLHHKSQAWAISSGTSHVKVTFHVMTLKEK